MDAPFHIRSFYKELIALYKKYELSISHEDSHGGFIIDNYNEHNVDWIMDAYIKANVPKLPDELSWLDEEYGVSLMNTEHRIVQQGGEVYINCNQLPTCPSNSNAHRLALSVKKFI